MTDSKPQVDTTEAASAPVAVPLTRIEIAAIRTQGNQHPKFTKLMKEMRAAIEAGEFRKDIPLEEFLARRNGYWVSKRIRQESSAPRELPNTAALLSATSHTLQVRRGDAHNFDVLEDDVLVARVEAHQGTFRIQSEHTRASAELSLQLALEQKWDAIYIHQSDPFFADILAKVADEQVPPVPVYSRTGSPLNASAREREALSRSFTSQALGTIIDSEPRPVNYNESSLSTWWSTITQKIKETFFKLASGHPVGAWLEPDAKMIDRELASRTLSRQIHEMVYRAVEQHSLSPDRLSRDYQSDTVGAVRYAHWLGEQGKPLPDWDELARLARESQRQTDARLTGESAPREDANGAAPRG